MRTDHLLALLPGQITRCMMKTAQSVVSTDQSMVPPWPFLPKAAHEKKLARSFGRLTAPCHIPPPPRRTPPPPPRSRPDTAGTPRGHGRDGVHRGGEQHERLGLGVP